MTVALGPLQKALVEAGLAEAPKPRKSHFKQFKCRKCKQNMVKVPDSNIMYCANCGNHYLFDKVM